MIDYMHVGDPNNKVYSANALKLGQMLGKGFGVLLQAVKIEEKNLFQRFFDSIEYVR